MNANSLRAVSFLAAMPALLTAQGRRNPDPVMLKHWPAPVYWQAEATAASLPASANPLVFVAMTPCRVADTRASQNLPAPFGPPTLAAGASRTFPLESSTLCSIPAAAPAYSLNVTVVPAGPAGFLTAYPSGQSLPLAATLVWSGGSVTSNAAIVPAGANGSIDMYANVSTDVVIDINGYYVSAGSVPTGTNNVALGMGALQDNTTGGGNVALGGSALLNNTTGGGNVAIGPGALAENTTGSGNIAIGVNVAGNVARSSSNNIHLGSFGNFSDNGAIRIGIPGTQTSFFAAGVRGVTTGSNDAVTVVIDSNGQLGTASSSQRFKEDIQDMGDASRAILDLRPVTFRYKKPFEDGSKPIQYGLVAEEVAAVFPDLVAHSADGRIETIKYQALGSLLLNELQRQNAEIRSLKERIEKIPSGVR